MRTETFRSKAPAVAFIGAYLTVLASLFPSQTRAQEVPDFTGDQIVYIEDNPGGSVVEYIVFRETLRDSGLPVEVTGNCYSACTFYLALPNLCAHPDAEFWFHAPYYEPQKGLKAYSSEVTAAYLAEYPPAIQQWIHSKGGLTKDWLVLKGREMRELVPRCTGGFRAS